MISLAALLLAAAQPEPPRGSHYMCTGYWLNFDGERSSLTLSRSFHPEYPSQSVYVEAPSVMRHQPGQRPGVRLRWGERPPFDWATGEIEVDAVGSRPPYAPSSGEPRPGDIAARVLVDRGGALRPSQNGENGDWEIHGAVFSAHLAGGLEQPSSFPKLRIPIESLLAWGSGRETVTVYRTIIATSERPGLGRALLGRERVVASYEINIPALARLVERIRAATARWEASLASDQSHCTLHENELRIDLPA